MGTIRRRCEDFGNDFTQLHFIQDYERHDPTTTAVVGCERWEERFHTYDSEDTSSGLGRRGRRGRRGLVIDMRLSDLTDRYDWVQANVTTVFVFFFFLELFFPPTVHPSSFFAYLPTGILSCLSKKVLGGAGTGGDKDNGSPRQNN